jgi:hypothetical protein
MGNRGNIAIVQDNNPDTSIYFYTHWRGDEVAAVVHQALAKRWRWNDPAYLARIIFDVMTEGQSGNETGFGISTSIQDNEYSIPVVNTDTQTVTIRGQAWTFDQFVALTPSEVGVLLYE